MADQHGSNSNDNAIRIQGAREHNLKNISLSIPRDQFVVITGVSGSGKSTLAFDLLFAEGQRRFLDSMNVYARQFVEQLSRPDVDLISGIPPTVSIEQRISRGGGKSTVATVTEIYHFLRLLFARLGIQYCPDCDLPVEAQTRDQIARRLQDELRQRGDLLLLAPVVRNRKGFHTEVGEWAARHGYGEVRADGKIHPTSQPLRLDRYREHDVEIVMGVLNSVRGSRRRPRRGRAKAGESAATVRQLIDETLRVGNGTLFALANDRSVSIHSMERACPKCGKSFPPLDPKMFSYNSPQGWCPACRGFGELFYLPDVDRGARAEAIEESWFEWQEGEREICSDCAGTRLNPIARAVRLPIPSHGKSTTRGIRRNPLTPALSPPEGERTKRHVSGFGGHTIVQISEAAAADALEFFNRLRFGSREGEIARDIVPEIRERLKFLCEVGLNYLQLGRGATTLSGGEAQRIRLAAQLGSNLSGVLYILDEPTIGLHARDNERLLAALEILKSRGNSLVVVEHDEETMRCADHIIDLGPGAGVHGGEVVATGTLKQLLRNKASLTGRCLREKKIVPARGERRPVDAGQAARLPRRRSGRNGSLALKDSTGGRDGCPALVLSGATLHNLKDVTVAFPLNRLVLVTGVSGSGKSTLVRECLLPALQARLKNRNARPGGMQLAGFESLRAVHEVDQSPIGRTPRSVPATYVGFFDEVRRLFAQLPEARLRGYTAGRFSFNSAQGRCPDCEGAGVIKLEMNFLPPAFVRCETCHGTRYDRETLDIEFHGKHIAQVLDLSVAEALEFFSAFSKIARPLQALCDTGLDYIKLGQTSPTLSGGEAQRMKLVAHLLSGWRTTAEMELPPDEIGARAGRHPSRPRSSLFILEEPTIGLHMADVRRLVEVLQRLIDAGHSVIVIEHNLDLIAEADWIIDLGPEGGDEGGRIVAEGTPEQVAGNRRSHTGRFLRDVLRG